MGIPGPTSSPVPVHLLYPVSPPILIGFLETLEFNQMYAIFKALGHQFKAQKGDKVRLPLMAAEPGSKVTFSEVLLTSDGTTIRAGTPFVPNAAVEAEVVGDAKGDKIYVFKFKRRKNYRRKTGHRQKYTEVRITDVKVG
jgi:large subunit ribosomal protein L21